MFEKNLENLENTETKCLLDEVETKCPFSVEEPNEDSCAGCAMAENGMCTLTKVKIEF